ncbi:MAG: hypothetical protein KDB23_33405, partial [Planctomycetales bacterium]|nr:hypothetical protein [Planctomycetales bacterium]
LNLPQYEHLFLGQLDHLMNTVFNRDYLSRWALHLGSVHGFSGASLLNSMDSRSRYVISKLPPRIPFMIGGNEDLITETTLLDDPAEVAVLVPTTENGGDQLGIEWTTTQFVETADWIQGTTGVGFETSPSTFASLIQLDVLETMFGQNGSIYMRLPFEVDNTADVIQLTLNMRFDDGFVAYLNGERVAAFNAPSDIAWNSVASASRLNSDAVKPLAIDLTKYRHLLVPGQNVLAIQGLNRSANHSDALFYPTLVARSAADLPIPEYSTNERQVTLQGSGWVDVKEIRLGGTSLSLPV